MLEPCFSRAVPADYLFARVLVAEIVLFRSGITPINEKPIKTIDQLIEIAKVESIMAKAGLEKVSQLLPGKNATEK